MTKADGGTKCVDDFIRSQSIFGNRDIIGPTEPSTLLKNISTSYSLENVKLSCYMAGEIKVGNQLTFKWGMLWFGCCLTPHKCSEMGGLFTRVLV